MEILILGESSIGKLNLMDVSLYNNRTYRNVCPLLRLLFCLRRRAYSAARPNLTTNLVRISKVHWTGKLDATSDELNYWTAIEDQLLACQWIGKKLIAFEPQERYLLQSDKPRKTLDSSCQGGFEASLSLVWGIDARIAESEPPL